MIRLITERLLTLSTTGGVASGPKWTNMLTSMIVRVLVDQTQPLFVSVLARFVIRNNIREHAFEEKRRKNDCGKN